MVTAVPDIRKKKIRGDDRFLLMGCDGLWETLSDLQIATFVNEKLNDANKTPLVPIIE